MTSILFLIDTILSQRLQFNYLRNKRDFRNFFWDLGNQDWIVNNFEKTMTLIADVFLNLRTPKNMVR